MPIEPEDRQRLLDFLERPLPPVPPDVAPPSEDELIALSENALEPARRRQVLAHLARDDELLRSWIRMHQEWEDLRAELREQRPPPRAPRAAWRGLAPWAGLAVAATLAGVLVWPLVHPSDPTAALDALAWPETVQPLHWSAGAKTPFAAPDRPEPAVRAAFAAGVADVLARAPASDGWTRLRSHYAERGAGVACPKECPAPQRTAWQLGRWAARARLACLGDSPPAPETLRELAAVRRAVAGNGDAVADADPDRLCAEAERLFGRYE